jgi:hypothetical protein
MVANLNPRDELQRPAAISIQFGSDPNSRIEARELVRVPDEHVARGKPVLERFLVAPREVECATEILVQDQGERIEHERTPNLGERLVFTPGTRQELRIPMVRGCIPRPQRDRLLELLLGVTPPPVIPQHPTE